MDSNILQVGICASLITPRLGAIKAVNGVTFDSVQTSGSDWSANPARASRRSRWP